MLCPACRKDTKVLETRLNGEGLFRRRRQCLNCDYRFTTLEIEDIKLTKVRKEVSDEQEVKKPSKKKKHRPVREERRPRREEEYEPGLEFSAEELGIEIPREREW